jgi:hypothetical protein
MNNSEPHRISNLAELKVQQRRLRKKLQHQEEEITFRMSYLKKNTPLIILHQLFPGNGHLNDKIAGLLELAIGFLINKLTPHREEMRENLIQRFFSWIADKFQDWFGRKKSTESES